MTLHDLLPLLRQQEPYTRLLDAVRRLSHPWVVGPAGAEKAYLVAALAEDLAVPGPGTAGPEPRRGVADAEPRRGVVLLATPSYDAAERLHDDLLTFAPTLEGSVMVFPQWDVREDGERPAPQIVGERVAVRLRLLDGPPPWTVAPVSALLRVVPAPDEFRAPTRRRPPGGRGGPRGIVAVHAET